MKTRLRVDIGSRNLLRFGILAFGRIGDREDTRGEVVQRHPHRNGIFDTIHRAGLAVDLHIACSVDIGLHLRSPVAGLHRIEVSVVVGLAALELDKLVGSLHNHEVRISLQTAISGTDTLLGTRRRRRVEVEDLIVGIERKNGSAFTLDRIVGGCGLCGIGMLRRSHNRTVGIEFQENGISSVNTVTFGIELHSPAVGSALECRGGFFYGRLQTLRCRLGEFVLILHQTGNEQRGEERKYE